MEVLTALEEYCILKKKTEFAATRRPLKQGLEYDVNIDALFSNIVYATSTPLSEFSVP